jgi:hypothetical protein
MMLKNIETPESKDSGVSFLLWITPVGFFEIA